MEPAVALRKLATKAQCGTGEAPGVNGQAGSEREPLAVSNASLRCRDREGTHASGASKQTADRAWRVGDPTRSMDQPLGFFSVICVSAWGIHHSTNQSRELISLSLSSHRLIARSCRRAAHLDELDRPPFRAKPSAAPARTHARGC
jgi:hypothetical protein